MINRLLIYPNLNYISTYISTKTGRFGKKVNLLYYVDNPTDQQIGHILTKEMDWRDSDQSEYTRHYDCLAEPFTNYIREKRFWYSRRLPQLSNMIRNNEITREEAKKIYINDKKNKLPLNYEIVKSSLSLNDADIQNIEKIPVNVFGNNRSSANKVFALIRNIIRK